MLFVSLLKPKAGTVQDRVAKRMQWQPPAGYNIKAEYWLMSDNPRVIVVAEVDDAATASKVFTDWEDLFEITVAPAITGEQGLELARQAQ